MALQLLYAPSEYFSFEQFSAQVSGLKTSQNYGMAKLTAVPVSPLATKVIAKFLHDDSNRSVGVEELAQLEFLDIQPSQRSALSPYSQGLYGHHMGRVSVVPAGETTHSYVHHLETLTDTHDLRETLAAALNRPEVEGEDIKEIAGMMARYTNGMIRLTEMRQIDGFSLFENVFYGNLIKSLYLLPAIFLELDHLAARADPQRLEVIKANIELYSVFNLLKLKDLDELDDLQGPNEPFIIQKAGIRDMVHL